MKSRSRSKRRIENTESLLKLLAAHLSGRSCCKGVEYTLIITDTCEKGYVFDTEVYVFPDRYHRKESDKTTVMNHILRYHMPEICNHDLNIFLDEVVPGTYSYILSVDKRRRRWIKKESASL